MQEESTSTLGTGPIGQIAALLSPGSAPPPLVVAAGPRGTGRTTLLRELASSSALDALWIDCSTFAADQPLRSLREAVATRVDPLFPAEVAAALQPALDETDPVEVTSWFWSVIRERMSLLDGRIVLADDFDLLDPVSRTVTATILRRAAQLGTPVVIAVDTAVDLPELDRQPVVELRGLDTRASRLMLEDLVGGPVPWRTAELLTNRTGGNLLALTDIVSQLSTDQLNGRELLPHPLPLSASAARRLLTADDPEPVQELLAGLATESSLSAAEAEAVLGGPDNLAAALAAERIRLVNSSVTPRTPAQALAAWALLGTPARRHVHARLAEVVVGPDACACPSPGS